MRAVLTYTLALLITLVLETCFSSHSTWADTPQAPTLAQPTECAAGVPLRLPTTPDFQRVKSDNPAVLCVFRHKTNGFPTLNVVQEPRMDGSNPPTLQEYEQGVAQGYRAVGLSDAVLSQSAVGESHGIPFFTSEITFSNQGAPMIARILVVQYHDRTYTASAIAEANPLEEGRARIAPLIDGIEVDGEVVRDTRHTLGTWPLVGALCGALLLAYIAFRSVRPRRGG